MNVGSLFSGIGGIDLGLERAGMRVAWQCERDAYCRGVLAQRWPGVPIHHDIRDVDDTVERVDILAGGFPCQPVSVAGKRRAQADERWLWPEFARCIRVLRPRYVLVENVPGLLSTGMGDVLGDLAAFGFDAEWTVFGARDVGAPHRRDRVWIVAYPSSGELQRRGEPRELARATRTGESEGSERERFRDAASDRCPDVADSDSSRLEGHRRPLARTGEQPPTARGTESGEGTRMAYADSQRLQTLHHEQGCSGWLEQPRSASGCPACWWSTEPDVGRVAHGVPARVDRLRALGNAVVPQCAEHVGRWIIQHAEGGIA